MQRYCADVENASQMVKEEGRFDKVKLDNAYE